MMSQHNFIEEAVEAGFSKEQAEFMFMNMAQSEHTHEIEDIEGLEQALDLDEGEDEEED